MERRIWGKGLRAFEMGASCGSREWKCHVIAVVVVSSPHAFHSALALVVSL